MNAMKCDRCGEFYTLNELPPYMPNITPEFRSGVSLDLCPECIVDFNAWLHTTYYFNEQLKMGHAIPCSIQSCGRCANWVYDKDKKERVCSLGNPYRSTDTVCTQWKGE